MPLNLIPDNPDFFLEGKGGGGSGRTFNPPGASSGVGGGMGGAGGFYGPEMLSAFSGFDPYGQMRRKQGMFGGVGRMQPFQPMGQLNPQTMQMLMQLFGGAK